MADDSPAPQRYYATVSWESEPMRAEKRIRRQIDQVLRLCYDGADLVRISKSAGAPGLRTLRRWVSLDLYGFGRTYHMLLRGRAVERIRAGMEDDLKWIRARVDRAEQKAEARREHQALRRNRTESRTG
jgi:hypothetical protein